MQFMMIRAALAAVLLFPAFLTLVTSALATDGVLEINQTCAVQTGCFAGDPAGLPVTITSPGSYRLTSNLDVSVAASPPGTTAIEIAANDVSIDLAGFVINGTTQCGTFGTCTNTGSGSGIVPAGGIRERISVRSGVIRGMGRYGVMCDIGCSVENVKVDGNGSIGIYVVNPPARIQGNLARNNGGAGIRAAGVISENIMEQNGGLGFEDRGFSVIARNRVFGNSGGGITCQGSTVIDNFIRFNSSSDIKIDAGTPCALGRNTLNSIDNSVGSFVEVDHNLCGGDLVCP